eukprot:scaffold152500_cov17-Tisochrysis_lutea.AAC.1
MSAEKAKKGFGRVRAYSAGCSHAAWLGAAGAADPAHCAAVVFSRPRGSRDEMWCAMRSRNVGYAACFALGLPETFAVKHSSPEKSDARILCVA